MSAGSSPAAEPPPGARPTLPGPGPAVPPGPVAPPDDASLTGAWLADDGGIYFLRQIGSALWWVGLSQDGAFYPGLDFCNVFHGTVTATAVTGEWSDVPRGSTANRGQLALSFVPGSPQEQRLLREAATGGFSGSSWRRVVSPWPSPALAVDLFPQALKCSQHVSVLFWGGGSETLAENLFYIRDAASVFGTVTPGKDHEEQAVLAGYPADGGRSYSDFICLNAAPQIGVGGIGVGGIFDQQDGDVTFFFLIDRDQIRERQPAFFAGIEHGMRDLVFGTMRAPVEGEIIMYGRAASCDDDAKETSPPLFPGWAEPAGNSVLFNGRPIPAIFPIAGAGPGRTFPSELGFGDPVRVTGALVFDDGHAPNIGHGPTEIHPVYSVDKITATFSTNLSGAWADDVGNTYYLRHDPADNAVWFAGLSPHGSVAFGQVFRGTFYPRQVVVEAAVPAGTGGPPVLPQDAMVGNIVAIGFGYGTAPPLQTSGTRLGDTGAVTFGLGQTQLAGKEVPMLATGDVRRGDFFRLMKLHDA